MLRDKHKNVSCEPTEKKCDKKSHHNYENIFAHCTGVKFTKDYADAPSGKEKDGKKSQKNGAAVKKLDKNQLLQPNSVFETDRRSSFSDYTTEQRRASYDRYSCNCSASSNALGGPERRASYDVSYGASSGSVKNAKNECTLHLAEDYKPERRGSLVQRWFNRISEAAEAYKAKEGKQRSSSRASDVSNVPSHDLDSEIEPVNQFTKTKENEHGVGETVTGIAPSINVANAQDEPGHGNESAAKKSGASGGVSPGQRRKRASAAEPLRLITENPLIEPSQVSVSERAVHTAEAVLTPLERLRRKDELIKEALQEKQKLVADILHVPKEEFETISDIAGEPTYDKEASELVLAAVNQADQLTSILNECLRVTEEDAVIAGVETNPTPSASGKSPTRAFPSVPVPKLQSISSSLSAHLTQLLSLVTERDEEREKLRHELQRSREQLHAMYEMQQRMQRVSEQSTSAEADVSQKTVASSEANTGVEASDEKK